MDTSPASDEIILTRLDHIILQNGGQTVNTERLPIRLERSKRDEPPKLEDLHREIGRLRKELACHQEAKEALMGLFGATREAYRQLHEALLRATTHHNGDIATLQLARTTQHAASLLLESAQRVSQRLSESESHLLKELEISLDDTDGQDITIF